MHLSFNYQSATHAGELRHAQDVMKGLGITYTHSIPQTILDGWQFFNCSNVPEKLPEFIWVFDVDPRMLIGRGLSEKDAEEIKALEAHL
jgi:hypothetical protein